MKIIKVGAIWCPGCLVMHKTWHHLIEKYPEIEFVELDYDMDSEVKELNVGSTLPVFIILKNNIERKRLIGEQKEEFLEQVIGELQQ